jgi:glycosyltransferase involved in cell wall biosynthesis
MKPKFSFIIPSLNEGKYIGRCLASIKKQGRRDYEIIVVDSYSKDATVKIARRYGARIFYEGRKGPAIARNTGAKHGRGEIFVFSDADVIFNKNFLDVLENKMTRCVIGGVCNMAVYDNNSKMIRTNYRIANLIVRFLISLGKPMTMGSCFIFRKNTFKKAGGFNPHFLTNEDHDMANRASKLGRFVYFKNAKIGTSTRRVKKWGLRKSIRVYFKSTIVFWLNHSYLKDYWN